MNQIGEACLSPHQSSNAIRLLQAVHPENGCMLTTRARLCQILSRGPEPISWANVRRHLGQLQAANLLVYSDHTHAVSISFLAWMDSLRSPQVERDDFEPEDRLDFETAARVRAATPISTNERNARTRAAEPASTLEEADSDGDQPAIAARTRAATREGRNEIAARVRALEIPERPENQRNGARRRAAQSHARFGLVCIGSDPIPKRDDQRPNQTKPKPVPRVSARIRSLLLDVGLKAYTVDRLPPIDDDLAARLVFAWLPLYRKGEADTGLLVWQLEREETAPPLRHSDRASRLYRKHFPDDAMWDPDSTEAAKAMYRSYGCDPAAAAMRVQEATSPVVMDSLRSPHGSGAPNP